MRVQRRSVQSNGIFQYFLLQQIPNPLHMGITRENAKRILEYLNGLPRQKAQEPEGIRNAVGMQTDDYISARDFLREINAITMLTSGYYSISPDGVAYLENYEKTPEMVTREEIDVIKAKIARISEDMLTKEKLADELMDQARRSGF